MDNNFVEMKTTYEIDPLNEKVWVVHHPAAIDESLVQMMMGLAVMSDGKQVTSLTMTDSLVHSLCELTEEQEQEIRDSGYQVKLILPVPPKSADSMESILNKVLDTVENLPKTDKKGEHFYVSEDNSVWILSDTTDLENEERGSLQWLRNKQEKSKNEITLSKCEDENELKTMMRTIESVHNFDVDEILSIADLVRKADRIHMVQVG